MQLMNFDHSEGAMYRSGDICELFCENVPEVTEITIEWQKVGKVFKTYAFYFSFTLYEISSSSMFFNS